MAEKFKHMEEALWVPINLVRVDEKWRPRDTAPVLDEGTAESIKTNGIIKPLHVRQKNGKKSFWIIDGEHRYEHAKVQGIKELPVIVHDADDTEALVIALTSQDQKPFTEAEIRRNILRLHHDGCDEETICRHTGYGARKVKEAIRIEEKASPKMKKANVDSRVASRAADLPKKVQDQVAKEVEGKSRSEALQVVREAEKQHTDRKAPGPRAKEYPLVKKPREVLDTMERFLKTELRADKENVIRRAQMGVVMVMKGTMTVEEFKNS